ncbi:MAG: site-2 protease family protein [Corynebacteriales bacterium]|nr:site-2 protease family protein [Mycobacteriales bacterium]
MTASIKLGRIAGVQIGVNWSVLIIFGLVTGALSFNYFPDLYPNRSLLTYVFAGLVLAGVFFAGLLAHEVSHAIVAQRNGIAVESITLWLLGGVAVLRGQPRTPGAQVRIAGIGPLVSLAIGLVFTTMCFGLAMIGQTGMIFGAFVWLAAINIALALFNLLPATPLDGGRLLCAGLWRMRGDRYWAAKFAARCGQGLGLLFVGLGLWQVLSHGRASSLWLAFVGWFVLIAAQSEERQASIGKALAGVRMDEVMSSNPETAPATMSIAEFVRTHMWNTRCRTFPLMLNNSPVGLVSLKKLRKISRERWEITQLREVSQPLAQFTLATPEEFVPDVLLRMGGRPDGRIFVVNDGQLVGIVSPADINKAVERAELRLRAGSAPFVSVK